MTRRLMLTMAVVAAGASAVVLLLLRPAPRAVDAPTPATAAPATAPAPTTPAPTGPPPTASAATPPTGMTPTHGGPSGPAPLPPGVKLQSGHPSGSPVPPEEVPPMPLEQRLEKAAQMASVLEKNAATLDQEVAAAEAAGRTDEATHKRVLAKRMRARVAELRADVEAKQAPQ